MNHKGKELIAVGRLFRFKEKPSPVRPNRSNVGRVNNALGQLHQARVGRVLLRLRDEGMILIVQETRAHDRRDKLGIDFSVTTLDGREVHIQVKSSEYYAELFRKSHPDIAVIVSNVRTAEEEIRRRIGRIVFAP